MALALAVGLAGCGGLSKPKPEDKAPTDPNAFPADYRAQLVGFLRQSLTDRADFRGAQIAPPVLKPIGDSQHYMACMQFTGRGQPKTKVADLSLRQDDAIRRRYPGTMRRCRLSAIPRTRNCSTLAITEPCRQPTKPAPLAGGTSVMENKDVLIVGAGPTGLTLAIDLGKRGVRLHHHRTEGTPGVPAENGAHQCANHGNLPPHGPGAERSAPRDCGPIVRWTSISSSR